MRKIFIFLLLVLLSMLLACKKTYEIPASFVVINEVMPVNFTTIADQDGEYDDWIELYNMSASSVDLSGFYLSDSKKNPVKWMFPRGTGIDAKGYLIVWADEDTTQAGLHSNFKLSSAGEDIVFSSPDKIVTDKVSFQSQTLQLSFSRVPDGTGSLIWQVPTFNKSNIFK